jgi:predicted Zn-dependent protease
MCASRLEVFKQMFAADPDNTMVRYGLANELFKAERYEETVEALNEYLRRADDEGAAYGMLARAYEKLGKREEARAAYEGGIKAAEAHGHGRTMAEDYRMTLETEYMDD